MLKTKQNKPIISEIHSFIGFIILQESADERICKLEYNSIEII